MLGNLINWVISAIAIVIITNYVPGFSIDSFETALIVALALGIVNAVIKPIITVLTLPINILTLGLFSFVINAGLILLVAQFIPGFEVVGFVPALIAAFVLWLINAVLNLTAFPVKAV